MFVLKNDEVKTLSDNLGGTQAQMTNNMGRTCWSQSLDKYFKIAIENKGGNCVLRAKFVTGYKSELDVTVKLQWRATGPIKK